MAVLDAAFDGSGAAAWGCVDFGRIRPDLSTEKRDKVEKLCPNPRTVLVAAFPYFAGETAGNLSVYARGEDYHLVLGRRLNTVCKLLREHYAGYLFVPGVDSSPLPERELAFMAGLGLRGNNGLLILPPYGSYVFLGTILTDAPLKVSTFPPAGVCISCGKCAAACPTAALEGAVFHRERCLSELTQKKGELTGGEESLLRRHPYIWGCDICQTACPYNQGAETALLSPFLTDLVEHLQLSDVSGLSNRQFKEKYGSRAFSWRGPAVLRRNLQLKHD